MARQRTRRPIERLEDVVGIVGAHASASGELFTQLCQLLLARMGFSSLERRRGVEAGRDIDGRHGGQTWYFECKRYNRIVRTPEAAYKLLQLELLPDALQPDFFVLMSNASVTSILRDIVKVRRIERRVKYSVELWTNEEAEATFNTILLSYPEIYIDFVTQHWRPESAHGAESMVRDFERRSRDYLTKRQPFFEALEEARGVVKKATVRVSAAKVSKYMLHQCFERAKEVFPATGLLVVGCPLEPVPRLYDFSNDQSRSSFLKGLKPWGVEYVSHTETHMVLAENRRDSSALVLTSVFDFGGFAVWTPLPDEDAITELFEKPLVYDASAAPYQRPRQYESIAPIEWLPSLRENCLRLRNFAKRGMLPTPAVFQAHIGRLGTEGLPVRLYTFDGLLATDGHDPSAHLAENGRGIFSDEVIVERPPNTHYEIGNALATSLWRRIDSRNDLLSAIRSFEQRAAGGRATQLSVRYLPYVSPAAAVRAVTEWLHSAERFDRSYAVFEMYLRIGHGDDDAASDKRYVQLHGDLFACTCGSGKSYADCHGQTR